VEKLASAKFPVIHVGNLEMSDARFPGIPGQKFPMASELLVSDSSSDIKRYSIFEIVTVLL